MFLEYTQAELDRNYNQADWAANIKQVVQRSDLRSDVTRQRLGAPERFVYGDDKVEGLDLFRAKADLFNHFEITDDFGNPYGQVSAAAIKQIKGK